MAKIYSLTIDTTTDRKEFVIELVLDGQAIDRLITPLDRHFDTLLVTCIDKLLKRNRIDNVCVNGVIAGPHLAESSVSYNIVLAADKALKTA